MEKIRVDLQNCYGIQNMNYEFNFHHSNVIAIYAKNGLMKTSFTKIFQKVQQNKWDDIKDVIFEDERQVLIQIDDRNIISDDVFVIKSFEGEYEADVSSLLVQDSIKIRLKEVLKIRDKLLKNLQDVSGIKIKRTSGGKTIYDLEDTLISDFDFNKNSILLNLEELSQIPKELDFERIKYSSIFDPTILKKITSEDFQQQIHAFILSCNQIYDSFPYLEKGHLTLPKLKDIKKALEKDSFFVQDNKLVLADLNTINSMEELDNCIAEIEFAVHQVPALRAIEGMLSDAKGILLKDVIEMHPEIVEYLAIEKLPILKKALWISYIYANRLLFDELCNKYNILSSEIDAIALDDTPWKQALDTFNKRFTVPFKMRISNLKGAIIGESIPKVEFQFKKGQQTKVLDRSKLDELDTLSQGEKRALYLLNIIFDIQQLDNITNEKLIIVDDIADSFDYKNKYAIIEYLYELAQKNKLYLIILSHNFDFYRTVSSRLNIKRENRLMANLEGGQISLEQELYQNQPFKYWKQNPCKKYILALIPFVRNIIEYGKDRQIIGNQDDFIFMTSLLHKKVDSSSITYSQLLPIYKEYLGIDSFGVDINLMDRVLDSLYYICDSITYSDIKLEDKIVLAMGIRHKAEEYMISAITNYPGQLIWDNGRGSSVLFMQELHNMTNQTRMLYNAYKQFGSQDSIKILDEVNIMTAENIHFNSFMYEPLLDMDVSELLELYNKLKLM